MSRRTYNNLVLKISITLVLSEFQSTNEVLITVETVEMKLVGMVW